MTDDDMIPRYPGGSVVMDEHVTAEYVAELAAEAEEAHAKSLAMVAEAMKKSAGIVTSFVEFPEDEDHHAYIAKCITDAIPADALAALDRVREEARREAVDTSAARDVLAERQRQVSQEGWTPEHDDQHSTGGIARAAACYALIGGTRDRSLWRGDIPNLWPWDAKWWKPKDRRRDLVRAAALILAEIERLDRAEARSQEDAG